MINRYISAILTRFKELRPTLALFGMVFLYLLAIALRRGTYGGEDALSLGEIIAFTLLPLLAGWWSRDRVLLLGGLLVASMVPFQKTVALVYVLAVLGMLPRLGSACVRARLRVSPIFRAWCAFLVYLLLLWLLRLGDTTDIWSLPAYFASALAIPTLYILLFQGLEWSREELLALRRMLLTLLSAQAAVVLLYPLLIGHASLYLAGFNGLFKGFNLFLGLGVSLPYADPDWNRGTLVDAHQLGFLLAILFAWVLLSALQRRSFPLLLLAVALLYLFGVTETTHAVPSLLVAASIAVALLLLSRFAVRMTTLTFTALLLGTLLPIVLAVMIYAGDTWFAHTNKALLYRNTLTYLYDNPLDALFGTGAGSFGSRVANKRLTDGLYKLEYPFPSVIGARTAQEYETVLKQAQKGIAGATAQVQVSGLVAQAAEFGLLGNLLLLFFLGTVFRERLRATNGDGVTEQTRNIALVMFTFVLISGSLCFRQYLEYPQIMAFACLLLLLPSVNNYPRFSVQK